jgi:hypothetical protein
VLGGAATTTGIGAAVGVPAMVVSTGMVVGGTGNVAAGIRGLTQAMMSKGSGSGGNTPKNVYSGVKNASGYPQNFTTTRGGIKAVTTRNNVSNQALLDQLRQIEPGTWQKVYKDGWIGSDKVSLHYFQSESGKVFDFAIKPGWSN